jgi:hypothetical protein
MYKDILSLVVANLINLIFLFIVLVIFKDHVSFYESVTLTMVLIMYFNQE